MSPITNGPPSWPRKTPVDMVHATRRSLTLSLLICLSALVALVLHVARLHRPVLGVLGELDDFLIGEREPRKSSEASRTYVRLDAIWISSCIC